MAEPASTTAGVLLVKYGVIIGGFAGAILSLTFLRGLTLRQAVAAFFNGLSTAVFCTPGALAEEVERLRLIAQPSFKAVSDYQLYALGHQPLIRH